MNRYNYHDDPFLRLTVVRPRRVDVVKNKIVSVCVHGECISIRSLL